LNLYVVPCLVELAAARARQLGVNSSCRERSERKPRAELQLERVRNRRRRGESTQVADGLVVGCRLIRSRPVLVTKVGPVQYIVELCENGQPLASRQREILGHPGVRVDERQPARVVDADWLSI